jgi:MYXO-CTERM domain-containing protein
MRIRTTLLGAVISVLILAAPVRADLIGVQLLPFPDIASAFIDVSYNAATDQFVATGFATLFDDDGSMPPQDITPAGIFTITATVDGSGNATNGTLTISGTIPGLGIGGTLLTGALTQFGFLDGGGPVFDFLFSVTGGELADDYFQGVGTTVGVILSGVSGFNGNWGVSWNNLVNGVPGTGSAVSDTALIPAPATLALLALAGLAARRRRREG